MDEYDPRQAHIEGILFRRLASLKDAAAGQSEYEKE